MTKSQVAIKYWENEVAEGRATKEVIELGDGRNSAIDKQVNDAIIDSNTMPDWNEFLAELNKVNEYEALYWMTYNRIKYLRSWETGCTLGTEIHKKIEAELNDLEAQLFGLKGGLMLTQEDQHILLDVLTGINAGDRVSPAGLLTTSKSLI